MQLLRKGNRGNDVLTLQKRLSAKTNYFTGAWDSIYGKNTEDTVKRFQRENGLTADGVVGNKTWAALDVQGSATNEPRTEHFSLNEFRCRDGSPVPEHYWANTQSCMNWLEKVRTACGNKAITINSGYRSPAYNRKVGGARASQHLYGSAADIQVQGMNPGQVYQIADKLMGNCGGVGKYNTFTHIDCRNSKSRW